MAVLKKLEDQLNCSICLDTYTNPKQLQCHHVYCQQCLVRLVIRDQQGQLSLTCPNCRQVTPIPANGVAGLQAAFRVNQLLEIVEEHKKAMATTANSATTNAEKVECASTSPTPQGNSTVGCPEHGGRELELYCETCQEAICYKCIKKGEKHISHNYEELDEAFERYKGVIMSSLEPMEKQLLMIEKALAQLDARHDEISDQRGNIEADIHNTIARLHETLDARKTELISQLHQLTQAKLKSLATQRDWMETIQTQLSSCLLFMKENLKTGNPGEVLMMKSTTVRQVKELTTTFQPDRLEPNTEADIIFSALADLTNECQNYGKVYATGSPDPSTCCAISKGVDAAKVGEKSTAVLQIMNFGGQPCKISMTSISCELVSEITGTRASSSVEGRESQSQYVISYQPTIKGRHQLHVKVKGQHIRGSPFPVTARSLVEELGTPILTINGVKEPAGVAINLRGEVVVTEEHGHCVTVFSPSGERLRSFGTCGSGQGQFQHPLGVAVDGEGNILVADYDNNRIQKFTSHGEFLTAVGPQLGLSLRFDHPRGIAVNPSNGRVYVGDWNDHVCILNPNLSYFGTLGKSGSGKGQFLYPRHIAFDNTGNVYVADRGNRRIQVFTAEGKFLRVFKGRGELNEPWGVFIDYNGRIHVSDFGNCHVSVFTSDGQFVTSFGSRGKKPGQFQQPQGVAVDSSGVVYVCDSGNNRIQLF